MTEQILLFLFNPEVTTGFLGFEFMFLIPLQIANKSKMAIIPKKKTLNPKAILYLSANSRFLDFYSLIIADNSRSKVRIIFRKYSMKNQKVNENPMKDNIVFLIYFPFPHFGQNTFIINKITTNMRAIIANSIRQIDIVRPILNIDVCIQ